MKLFRQYWSMGSFEGRCALLRNCIFKKSNERSGEYSIFEHNVCKNMLLRTLQINKSRLSTALQKGMDCNTYKDCRGKFSGGLNALPQIKEEEVWNHINSFPKYVSHYTRAKTESKFLSPDLNLGIMYRLYVVEHENAVSESFYKKIFYSKFNLRFKVPKKDTCLKCDVYKSKSMNAQEPKRSTLQKLHDEHLERATFFQKQMKDDIQLAKTDITVETLTFDLQKTLPIPKLCTSIVYYKRQLNFYNFGIHVGSSDKGIFNVWQENEASRGTQEVGSCLRMYIERVSAPVKKLILWSDSCGGQNRSIKLVLMLMYILANHDSLQTICLRYLQSGHTFLPNDSDFGDVECYLKKNIYTDTDYINIMKECRIKNKFVVNRLSSKDFFSVNKLEDLITNRKVDIENNKINWLDTHEIVLEKSDPFIIRMGKSIGSTHCQKVNISNRRVKCKFNEVTLDPLWPSGRVLSAEKVKDLKDILDLVPDNFKDFYSFIFNISTSEFIDDVDGFGQSIDFTVMH